MAPVTTMSIPIVISFILLSLTPSINGGFSRSISKEEFSKAAINPQNLTHLQFYFHDYVSNSNPTAIRIAQASTTAQSSTSFGALVMIDDPLTEAPDNSSKVIGHAQGMYGFADQQEFGLLMVMNLVFSDGQFNGSTLSLIGRNPVMESVREMAIVGGSGLFRFASGYAQAHTITMLDSSGATVVEYNVYVSH